MNGKKYLYIAVLSINLVCSASFSNYEQFEGFEPFSTQEKQNTSKWQHVLFDGNTTAKLKLVNAIVSTETNPTVTSQRNEEITISNNFPKLKHNLTTPDVSQRQRNIIEKLLKIKCPEIEETLSIGSYMIPTQRDLLLFTQRALLRKFNSYHEKTQILLKEIKEATQAMVAVEKICDSRGKRLFKKCVKKVNKKCVSITKKSIQSLERQKAEVSTFTEDKICNLTSMNINPLQQIKLLAMEETVLEFALPAFLRLLGACTVHCNIMPPSPDHRPKLRKPTGQDLKKILIHKKYLQFL